MKATKGSLSVLVLLAATFVNVSLASALTRPGHALARAGWSIGGANYTEAMWVDHYGELDYQSPTEYEAIHRNAALAA